MAYDRSSRPAWRAVVFCAASAGALALLTTTIALAKPKQRKAKRTGKVVRVERPRVGKKASVRICPMPYSDTMEGMCYGGQPAVGDTAELYDFEKNYIGKIKVTSVSESDVDVCESSSTFEFKYQFIKRPAKASQRGMLLAIAIFGVELDPTKAEVMTEGQNLPSPSTESRAAPWMGLDRDGNGQVDIVVTAFECTDIAPVPPPTTTGRTYQTYCLDYWTYVDHRWRETRRDYVHNCF